MSERAKFVNGLIGLLWREGAQGPNEFDCWGLVRHVQRELFGRELPVAGITPEQVRDVRTVIRLIENHPVRAQWIEVADRGDGDLVEMAHRDHPHHIGVFLALDRGAILHTTQNTGVSFDAIPALRVKGFARLKFYRFNPPSPLEGEGVGAQSGPTKGGRDAVAAQQNETADAG